MSNFADTLITLYQDTDKIPVYIMRATSWDQRHGNYPDIGIRHQIADHPERDPVIDGTPFMIAGTVYNVYSPSTDEVQDFDQFMFLIDQPQSTIRIKLRAISGTFPIATIDLGTYTIEDYEIFDVDKQFNVVHGIRANLKRRSA